MSTIKSEGKWGFINDAGEEVVKPKYDSAGQFNEGLAPVELEGEWYYINKTGEIVF